MKTKTILKKILLAAALSLASLAGAVDWTNYPVGVPQPGDTFLFGALGTNQFGCPTNGQIAATNLGAWLANNPASSRVVNPLASGVNYTSPPIPGWLMVNVIYTNSSAARITNLTTAASQTLGAINALGTNYESVYVRTASNNIVLFTNVAGVVPIQSSSWQP
jgi:hypothetical protein